MGIIEDIAIGTKVCIENSSHGHLLGLKIALVLYCVVQCVVCFYIAKSKHDMMKMRDDSIEEFSKMLDQLK